MRSRLKTYEDNQSVKTVRQTPESSGVACTELDCPGEMMIRVPHQGHYSSGNKGEPGAIKTELLRAICSECGWLGWV